MIKGSRRRAALSPSYFFLLPLSPFSLPPPSLFLPLSIPLFWFLLLFHLFTQFSFLFPPPPHCILYLCSFLFLLPCSSPPPPAPSPFSFISPSSQFLLSSFSPLHPSSFRLVLPPPFLHSILPFTLSPPLIPPPRSPSPGVRPRREEEEARAECHLQRQQEAIAPPR